MINNLMKSLRFTQECRNRLCPSQLVETPSPLSPSPYEGEGELIERGASPLLYTPLLIGSFRGTQSLSTTTSPSPLKERGIKGVR